MEHTGCQDCNHSEMFKNNALNGHFKWSCKNMYNSTINTTLSSFTVQLSCTLM